MRPSEDNLGKLALGPVPFGTWSRLPLWGLVCFRRCQRGLQFRRRQCGARVAAVPATGPRPRPHRFLILFLAVFSRLPRDLAPAEP